MNPLNFGTIIATEKLEQELTKYIIQNGNQFIEFICEDNKHTVKYLGLIDLKFVDTIINDSVFKREIEKDTLYIKDNEIFYS